MRDGVELSKLESLPYPIDTKCPVQILAVNLYSLTEYLLRTDRLNSGQFWLNLLQTMADT